MNDVVERHKLINYVVEYVSDFNRRTMENEPKQFIDRLERQTTSVSSAGVEHRHWSSETVGSTPTTEANALLLELADIYDLGS